MSTQAPRTVNLPSAFESRMRSALGETFSSFKEHLQDSPPVSIRLNPAKHIAPRQWTNVPWCAEGRYLAHRPIFTLDPLFHAGAYYVQEASSMFLEQVVSQTVDRDRPLRVLDLCAAPGGKSTHLLSLMNHRGLLVSNEVIASRISSLAETIQKWGHANVVITNNDPKDFSNLVGFFDVIVVDAPCSGEGLFRKNPDAIREWSEENVTLCSQRQRRILSDIWPSLKQEGTLIYSTCTYNQAENEEILQWLIDQKGAHSIPMADAQAGIETVRRGPVTGYRFFPHLVAGEGFFVSAVRKTSTTNAERRRHQKERPRKPHTIPPWILGDFDFVEDDSVLAALPREYRSDVAWLRRHLNVRSAGVEIASFKHNKLVPSHALALSTHLNPDEFPGADLSHNDAITYLRKDPLPIDHGSKGFVLVRYQGLPLGWINKLDRRDNNLYPSQWRIRMKGDGR